MYIYLSYRLFYILIIIYCINKIKSINHLLYKLDFRVRSILLCTMVFCMIRNYILYFRSFFDEQTLHFFENFFSLFPIIAFSIFNSSPKNIKTLTYLVIRTQCTLKILPYFLQNACFHKFIRSTIAKSIRFCLMHVAFTRPGGTGLISYPIIPQILLITIPSFLLLLSILNDFDTGNVLIIG